jgi:cytochrome c oxidase subunit IV
VIYIALTLLKAFYIVAYFMHLKFERINLIYSILLPTIFVMGVIAALMYESDYWFTLR